VEDDVYEEYDEEYVSGWFNSVPAALLTSTNTHRSRIWKVIVEKK